MLAIKYSQLNNYLLTQTEWKLFYNLYQFLELFNNITNDLSTQSYPTVAYLWIILLAIKIDLYADKGYEFLLNNVINSMKEKFDNYYEILKETTHIFAFLDPRYKNYCFSEMNEEEILLPIQQKLEQEQPITSKKSTKISPFLQKLKASKNIHIFNNGVSKYWNSNEVAEDIKLLEWWKTHSSKYSNLLKLAFDYLYI